jgi:hypothetical protein
LKFKSSRVQEFKSSRVQEFKSSRVQEFKSSRVQEFKSSRVQEFKSSDVLPLLCFREYLVKRRLYELSAKDPWTSPFPIRDPSL